MVRHGSYRKLLEVNMMKLDINTLPNIWPDEKPSLDFDSHGWFSHNRIFEKIFTKDVKNVCELGSWLGSSTRFILDCAPNCHLYAIDHWSDDIKDYGNGGLTSAKHDPGIEKITTLWNQFLANCWDYRERLHPIRSYTNEGLRFLSDFDIQMDVVYIDASHGYENVYNDISDSLMNWPNAKIIGDDYSWVTVRKAVHDYADRNGFDVEVFDLQHF